MRGCGECRLTLLGGTWATFSRALDGRAQQASAPTKKNNGGNDRRRGKDSEISNLRFQISDGRENGGRKQLELRIDWGGEAAAGR